MKIGIMTRWNVPSGQFSHAEPMVEEWRKMGHKISVFSAGGLDDYIRNREDEPFVHRCFVQDFWGTRQNVHFLFDHKPFLEEDYEVFVMEMAYLMPMPELLEIFPRIRKKAKTVLVVHETGLVDDPNWYKFEWDAIVCFDERYKAFMSKAYPKVKMSIIPFPCHPPFHGAQREARIRLGLPLDRKIIFAYGFNIIFNHVDLFPVMEKLSKDYPLSLLLLTHHDPTTLETKPEFLIFRDEMPSDDRLYEYLHASDAYLYHGRECAGVGVSSSTATCFGAGRPVVVSTNCNFFDLSGKEVIKYNNMPELEQRLRDVFESAGYVKESLNAAEEYATKNSGAEIAKQFIGLLSEVLGEQVHAQTTSRK